jgi:NAD(P)-dependent dehydrogenase (short-subunit alcohol dehydrogenase family)
VTTPSAAGPLPDLTGQVALVTGTTSGLGRRFAEVLAHHGAAVVLTGRRADRLDAMAEELREDGHSCLPLPLDVTDAESLPAAIDKVREELGIVTILVNNAGIPDARLAHTMPLDLIDRVLDTNLRAPYVLSCAVARDLIESDRPGRIVNISSMFARTYADAGASLYSITKAGVVRMTEVLAVEWARYGINVNCIMAGAVSTEMLDGMIERVGDPSGGFPRKRLLTPAQIDSTLLYLVSADSEAVTGATIAVDDGQYPR